MIRRRGVMLGLIAGLGGCALSERPFAERRQWPLQVVRPIGVPARRGRPVLELRDLLAGPGLEDGLRQWLAQSGLFAAVTGAGSRLAADLAFDGTLTAFWADPAHGLASATIAFTLIDLRPATRRVVVQSSQTASVPLLGADATNVAQALRAAAAAVFRQIEAELRAALPG